MYTIEVDDDVMGALKKAAEPFVDTPNAVLRRLLLSAEGNRRLEGISERRDEEAGKHVVRKPPRALQQVLAVVREVRVEGLTRIDATHKVADRQGIAFQTVLDKYCRQLGLEAHEFDQMLSEPNLHGLGKLLQDRFPRHGELLSDILMECAR